MDDTTSTMIHSEVPGRIAGRSPWALLSIVTAYCAVQAWLIATSVMPADDGVRYMRQAIRLESEPWRDVFRGSEDHPGFPMALHGAFSIARRVGFDSPAARILLAELVGSAAGLALILVAFHLARRVWGLVPAWIGLLAFAFLPRPAWQIGDILSDSSHAALWLASAGAFATALPSGRLGLAAAAGCLGSLAYWVRVDALTLPVGIIAAIATVLASRRWRRETPRKRALAAGAIYVALFAAGLVPFLLARGGISGKPVLRSIFGIEVLPMSLPAPSVCSLSGSSRGSLAMATAGPGGWTADLPSSLWDFVNDLAQEVQFVHVATLLLAAGLAFRYRRCSVAAACLGCVAAVHAVAVVTVRIRAGYLAGRYFLPWLPLMVSFGIWGGMEAATLLRSRGWLRLPGRWRPDLAAALAIALVSLAASLPSLAMHATHQNGFGVMQAGLWLRETLVEGDTVHDPYFFPTYAAGLGSRTVPTAAPAPIPATAPARGSARHYVIVQDRDLAKMPEIARLIQAGALTPVAEFPRRRGGARAEVRVYRWGGPEGLSRPR